MSSKNNYQKLHGNIDIKVDSDDIQQYTSNLPVNDNINISNNTESSNSSVKTMFISIVIVYIILFIGFIIVGSQLVNQSIQMNLLKSELNKLNNDYISYKLLSTTQINDHNNRIPTIESNQINNINKINDIQYHVTNLTSTLSLDNKQIITLNKILTNHTNILFRLSNRTSNAEVLDQLKLTKADVDTELDLTKKSIYNIIDTSTKNISEQLDQSKKELNNNLINIQNYLNEAKGHIYAVENNVTGQLKDMSMILTKTINDMNIVVQQAQTAIHDEVDHVRGDIDIYVAATNKQFAAENDFVKYQLAGTFTLLGCLISLWHITSHLRHYEKPSIQRRVTAVLWMVPIYGITSWLALVFPSAEFALGALRDCFEAYVVYTFIGLLIAILEDGEGPEKVIELLTKHIIEERRLLEEYQIELLTNKKLKKPPQHLIPTLPCCYDSDPPSIASAWLNENKIMVMQFVFMKPLLIITTIILKLSNVDYDNIPILLSNHTINFISPKLYIIILQNLSVATAFYGLLSFYHGTEKDLAWCNPWPKFLCIKGVVFMTFWQGAVLQITSMINLIDSRTASQLQNLLICIEMLLASLAHFYIFPYHEWQEGYQRDQQRRIAIKDTFAVSDFYGDFKGLVKPWNPSLKIKLKENEDEEIVGKVNYNHSINSLVILSSDSEFEDVSIENDTISHSINPLFPEYFTSKKYYQLNDSRSDQSLNSQENEGPNKFNPLAWFKRKQVQSLSNNTQLDSESIGLLTQPSDDSVHNYGIDMIKINNQIITKEDFAIIESHDTNNIIENNIDDNLNIDNNINNNLIDLCTDGNLSDLLVDRKLETTTNENKDDTAEADDKSEESNDLLMRLSDIGINENHNSSIDSFNIIDSNIGIGNNNNTESRQLLSPDSESYTHVVLSPEESEISV